MCSSHKEVKMEIWKTIPNFSSYEASNLGRVRSLLTVRNGQPLIMKTKVDKGGYLTIPTMHHDNGSVKTTKVHRLVAYAFIPNPKNNPQINHKDGNKLNNTVDNLEWITHKENFIHATNHGLRPIGEEHGRHKLTWEQVDYIRNIYKKGDKEFGTNGLARKFGVTPRVITLIMRNEIWSKKRLEDFGVVM